MSGIDVFYQGEGIAGIQHLEFPADETVTALKLHLTKKHGFTEDVLIFIEDEEEPVEGEKRLQHCAGPAGIKVHLHRCRRVEVKVVFNGQTVEHEFAPGTTVARVKHWAAEKKFGMSKEEAAEH